MKLSLKRRNLARITGDVLILPILQRSTLGSFERQVDERLGGEISKILRREEFYPSVGSILMVHTGERIHTRWVALLGLGKKSEVNVRHIINAFGAAARHLCDGRHQRLVVAVPDYLPRIDEATALAAAAEGLLLGAYHFTKYLTDKRVNHEGLQRATLLTARSRRNYPRIIEEAEKVCEAVDLARDLGNEPSQTMTPEDLAEVAAATAKDYGLKCRILDVQALEKAKMGGLLAVGRGSINPPRMIIMEWRNSDREGWDLGIVGKGITFDTGGISLKPDTDMDLMKFDMSGAGTTLGIMRAIADLELECNVLAVMCCAENMPSQSAYKPGDIITISSGKTVEVINTDAEGRIAIADGLHYIAEEEPDFMIDFATLTGSCVVALGHHAAGMFSNDPQLAHLLAKAADDHGEVAWEMPMLPEYAKDIKSKIADVNNVGSRYGGAISGAKFLEHFVGKTKWAHFDIAGTAWAEKPHGPWRKGSTGWGVRMVVQFLKDNYA